jgi:hypothetical protein
MRAPAASDPNGPTFSPRRKRSVVSQAWPQGLPSRPQVYALGYWGWVRSSAFARGRHRQCSKTTPLFDDLIGELLKV